MKRRSPNVKMKRRPPITSTEVVKHGPGRRGAFQPWMCEVAKNMVGKLGARINDLAEHFGVCSATIDYWIKNRPEFEQAVKYGRMECMLKVSGSLYQRAIGYSHPDIHIMSQTVKEYDEDGKVVRSYTQPLITDIIKHYPPDTPAAIKYLSILAREFGWAEVTNVNMDVKHSGDINIHKIEELSLENIPEEIKSFLFELNMKQLSDVQSN